MKTSRSSTAILAGLALGALCCADAGVAVVTSGGASEVILDPPSLNFRVNGKSGEISGQQKVTVRITYSGSMPGSSSCRKVRWLELHVLRDDNGNTKDTTHLNKSLGPNEEGTCSFDATSASFEITPFSETEIRSFCSGGAGRTSGQDPIRRRIEVLLYGPGEKVLNNRVNLQLVNLYANVACVSDSGTLIAKSQSTAPGRSQARAWKHGAHSASTTPGKQIRELAAPATAKENLDRTYKELLASYANYEASYEAYKKKRDYCLNKSYTLQDQAAAGCKDSDTWRTCKQEVINVCMGEAPDNLATAKKKIESDAVSLQNRAEKLSLEIPDPSQE